MLAYALSRRGYVALLAGLVMMANSSIYSQSLRVLADGSTGMLVAGFCASVILAGRKPWFHLVAGVFAALAYYAKGSELMLLALYPLLAFFAGGFTFRIYKRKCFYAGMATGLLLLAPFWYGNYREYGNPLHSTQNYVSGFYGLENWESTAYFPFWGQNLPKTSDRWEKHAEYREMAAAQVLQAVQIILTGAEEVGGDVWADFGTYGMNVRKMLEPDRRTLMQRLFQGAPAVKPMKPVSAWESPAWELAGVGAVALLIVAVACLPMLMIWTMWRGVRWLWRRHRVARSVAISKKQAVVAPSNEGAAESVAVQPRRARLLVPPMRHDSTKGRGVERFAGGVLVVWVVLSAHVMFLSYFWEVNTRFCFPMLPLVLALGCAAASRFAEWPIAGVLWLGRWVIQLIRRGRPAPGWAVRTGAVLRCWPAVVTLVVAGFVWFNREPVYAAQTDQLEKANVRGDYPFPQDDRYVSTGRWIAKKLPTAVVMCRNPWELDYYMSATNKAIGLPNPGDEGQKGAEQIFAIGAIMG